MKRNIITDIFICTALAFAASSCAEMPESYDNDKEIRYINKWIEVYNKEQKEKNPEAEDVVQTGKGIYILNETLKGNGRVFKEKDYVIMDYDVRDLEGNILKTTDRKTAQDKMGVVAGRGDYFGAETFAGTLGLSEAGIIESFAGLSAGCTRDVLIPSWLFTIKNYATAEEYQKHKTDKRTCIYSMKIRAVSEDYKVYQDELMKSYLPEIGMTETDTLTKGFYYKTMEKFPEEKAAEDKDKEEEKKDTSFTMIRYTGKFIYKEYSKTEAPLLTKTFDTTDERLAKDEGIYNPKGSYTDKKTVWGEKAEEIRMEGSELISGFYKMLWKMKEDKAKKAIGIFNSDLGYGRNGSGKAIPGYTPLVFEIERTKE